MNEIQLTTRALDFERVLDHPPEKVWRALTQPHLLGEWLMQLDFSAVVGGRFTMKAEWGEVTGTVLAVESARKLSYTWQGPDLASEVTWTLTPKGGGAQCCASITRRSPPTASRRIMGRVRVGRDSLTR